MSNEPPCPHRGNIDRYLLRELSEQECNELEGHYFECSACGEEIRTAQALIEGARAVAARAAAVSPRISWWRRLVQGSWPAGAQLAAACAVLLLFGGGYQQLVTIPELKREIAERDRPISLAPIALRPTVRSAQAQGPLLAVAADQPYAVLAIMPEGPEPTAYRAHLLTGAGAAALEPFDISAREPLYLHLPVKGLAPGPYVLELFSQPPGKVPGPLRYRFVLEKGR
jgi:hypothetical protein